MPNEIPKLLAQLRFQGMAEVLEPLLAFATMLCQGGGDDGLLKEPVEHITP